MSAADSSDPDLQRIIEDMAPEDHALTVPDPSPALRELVEIAEHLNEAELDTLLAKARFLLDHGR